MLVGSEKYNGIEMDRSSHSLLQHGSSKSLLEVVCIVILPQPCSLDHFLDGSALQLDSFS